MADIGRPFWRKSTWCDSNNCVQVVLAKPLVAVRDGKDRDGPVLTFGVAQWRAFVASLRDHEL
jgi:hypothetical protein